MIILGADLESIKEVKRLLKERFEMKDEGEARVVLGIRIQRLSDGKLAIDQSRYAAGIVQTYLEEDDPPTLIPMEPSAVTHLAETGGALFHDPVIYTQAIGKLLHLCHSRPDIVFAVHKLCQFARCPYQIHWAALRRILQYIKGTVTFGIRWSGPNLVPDEDNYKHGIEGHAGSSKKDDVLAFSDSDHASDPTDRKSCRGAVFLVQGGAVAYKSEKQKSVASSTAEAEYIALSMATKMAIWVRKMVTKLERFGVTNVDGVEEPVPILFGDNKASIQLGKGISNTGKIKHIDTAFHEVKDESRKGTILLQWVPGDQMLADGFTKPLPRVTFEIAREKIGVCGVGKSW